MSTKNLTEKIKLKTMNEILNVGNESNGDIGKEMIKEVPLKKLHTFKNHPFRVVDDEKMDETVDSIKEYGVLVPGIVRMREDGEYEIISGHRRKRACEIAGLETMPVIVKHYTDDEAVQIMVDANIQREDILPSEKAKAYSMKYEAMKHQGVTGGLTLEAMGEAAGENGKTIQRFIYLARLNDDLLQMVDDKKLGMGQGIDFSWLDQKAQKMVCDVINECKCVVSGVQSAQIKALYKEGKISSEKVWKILSADKPKARKVVFNSKRLDSYFTPNVTSEEIEKVIIGLLEEWKQKGGSDIDG